MIEPKLALIPSAYKANKVYSVLPSDGTGDFDFTRDTIATRVNKEGLIETVGSNVPRLNYPLIDGVVSGCPSLLLEPESRNLVTYSEDFTQGVWNDLNVSATSNQAISPDGTLSAFELTLDATNNDHSLIHSTMTGLSVSTNHIISVFVKSNGNDKVALRDASVGDYISVDLSNGSILDENNINSSIEKFGNDWYRISITFLSSSSGQIRPSLYLLEDSYSSGSPTSSYLGDGVSSVYVWGFQAEQQLYATSYIPTSGATATRSAETCNNAGDVNTFNDSEGVLMAEVNFKNNDTNKGISISDGTSSNRVLFYLSTNGNLYGYVFNGNVSIPIVNIIDTNFQINLTAKLAIKYKQNDFSFWVNGIEIGTETSGNTFSSGVLDQLSFTEAGASANRFYGNVKQIQYFDTALNNTDLETLTSWRSFNEMATALQYTIL